MRVYDNESVPDISKAKMFRGMDVGGSLFFSGCIEAGPDYASELEWSSSLI